MRETSWKYWPWFRETQLWKPKSSANLLVFWVRKWTLPWCRTRRTRFQPSVKWNFLFVSKRHVCFPIVIFKCNFNNKFYLKSKFMFSRKSTFDKLIYNVAQLQKVNLNSSKMGSEDEKPGNSSKPPTLEQEHWRKRSKKSDKNSGTFSSAVSTLRACPILTIRRNRLCTKVT